jgi:hypothetical protein
VRRGRGREAHRPGASGAKTTGAAGERDFPGRSVWRAWSEKIAKNLEILWTRGIKGLERVLRPDHVLEVGRSKNSMHKYYVGA